MISVCMATYNGAKYIRKQIDSILCQLGKDDELIISDDNSSDDTVKIIRNINDKRIKIISHLRSNIYNRYSNNHYMVTSNFENALSYANGDYIFLSDQDDIWHPERIALMSKALETHPIVYAPFTMIDENEHKITTNQKYPHITGNLFRDLITQPYFGCCMAFRRSLLNVALPFPKGTITHDNWVGLLAEILGVKIHILETPLLYYRIHSNNVSHRINSNPLLFKIYYRIKQLLQLYNRKYHSNTAKLIQI